MTWREIKQAVEQVGLDEDEEIVLIQCERSEGDHTFQKIKLGKAVKLAENVAEEAARKDAEGCAI
jgi:hypothetical protein